MKNPVFAVVLAIVTTASVLGQAPPAKELARLDPLLGNWEGSGTAAPMSAGGAESKWTSRITAQKILGGHFIQEDTRVDLDGMPEPLVFRAVYGFDARIGRFTHLGLGNTGEAEQSQVYWTENGGLVGSHLSLEQGVPVVQRWVFKFTGKDVCEFRIEQAQGTGEFQRKVTGAYQRGGAGWSSGGTCTAVAPVSPEMKKFDAQLGDWTMKGSFSMAPGSPMTSFTGRESVRAILGGHVHYAEMASDEINGMPAWQGHYYHAWDPANRSFRSWWFDNMGSASTDEIHAASNTKFVAIGARVEQNLPQAVRSVIDLTKDRIRSVSHRCAGDHAPDKWFEAEWTRVAGKSDEKPAADRGDKK